LRLYSPRCMEMAFRELRHYGVLRSSHIRFSAKFALMESSEVRVRQVSYSRLYEP
jgi:hypothetical protein